MKPRLSMVAFAGLMIIITFTGCTKEDPSNANYVSPASYSTPPPLLDINLVANNWFNSAREVYVDLFQGVLGMSNTSGNRTVLIYIEEGGKEVQINQRHIAYMGNELWATNTATDVSIVYRCSTRMPFSSINVRVEVR
jgi:hypothetical protein